MFKEFFSDFTINNDVVELSQPFYTEIPHHLSALEGNYLCSRLSSTWSIA